MPRTIWQERVDSAARVLTKHYPAADRTLCQCGQEWHPLHQALMLDAAGLLGPNPWPNAWDCGHHPELCDNAGRCHHPDHAKDIQ